jgi:hypothetical protein
LARTKCNILNSSRRINMSKKLNVEKIWLIATVFVVIFLSRSRNFYVSLYHNFPLSIQMEIFVSVMAAVVFTLPVILSTVWFSIRMTRFVAGVFILFAFYTLFRDFFPERFENNALIVLTIAFISFFAAGIFYFSDRPWHRGAPIILIAVSAWSLSPLLLAWIQSDQATHRTLTIERVVRDPPKAVVVLILDEMSPELAPLLRPVLTDQGHILHVGQVKRAGENTVNAIPSMLTPQRHDDVAPCGATSLCGTVFFDMARLRASRPDTDVVGFFHPYCAVLGLRSCWIAKPGNANLEKLFNRLIYKFQSVTAGEVLKLREPLSKSNLESMREAITQNALNAPFWSEGGGILYVHQLLPHPGGARTGLGLDEEYHDKMLQAVRFVSLIKDKLQRNFGKEYLLIVTSDHPLRSSMWCREPEYENVECLKENFVETANVPFMALAPQNVTVTVPTTNVAILSPLP